MTTHTPATMRADTHRKHIRDFWYHAAVYVFVIAILVILDITGGTTSSREILGMDWAYWVALPWGLGLAGHAIWAYLTD